MLCFVENDNLIIIIIRWKIITHYNSLTLWDDSPSPIFTYFHHSSEVTAGHDQIHPEVYAVGYSNITHWSYDIAMNYVFPFIDKIAHKTSISFGYFLRWAQTHMLRASAHVPSSCQPWWRQGYPRDCWFWTWLGLSIQFQPNFAPYKYDLNWRCWCVHSKSSVFNGFRIQHT